MGRTTADLVLAEGIVNHHRRGTILFLAGDPSTDVWAVASGRVTIFLDTPQGRTLVLGEKRPGEIFGELSALDGRPRSASARMADDGAVARLDQRSLLDHLETSPDQALHLLRALCDRMRDTNAIAAARTSDSVADRLAGTLLDLTASLHRHDPAADGRLALTQAELAGWLGATRETTARELAALREIGAVETGRGWVRVVDPAALRVRLPG